MKIDELLDAAKRKKGSLKEIAHSLGISQSRLSEWKNGKWKPDATQIAYLANMAELPILETIAQIEYELDERFSGIWLKALDEWRARRDSNPRPLPSEGDGGGL